MKRRARNVPGQRARSAGFVLVTSMIFLVLLTLLALSAMRGSTLEERMASSQREYAAALQRANDGLREGERRLADPALERYASGAAFDQAVGLSGDDADAAPCDFDDEGDAVDTYFEPTPWRGAARLERDGDGDGADAPADAVLYCVRPATFAARDLNPETAAAADGVAYFRITARGDGARSALAITQSTYAKHY